MPETGGREETASCHPLPHSCGLIVIVVVAGSLPWCLSPVHSLPLLVSVVVVRLLFLPLWGCCTPHVRLVPLVAVEPDWRVE
jgi:apolipoprotein N-acyltransferase